MAVWSGVEEMIFAYGTVLGRNRNSLAFSRSPAADFPVSFLIRMSSLTILELQWQYIITFRAVILLGTGKGWDRFPKGSGCTGEQLSQKERKGAVGAIGHQQ
jgi:hypothetical protein